MAEKILTVELPDVGEGVLEGEVLEWLKEVGSSVELNEPVVLIMTDKATVELPSPYEGTLVKQHYQQGEVAIVDTPLYDMEVSEDTVAITTHHQSSPPSAAPSEQHEAPSSDRVKVQTSPKVRKLAKELGINLEDVEGTGKGGRILESDLQAPSSPKGDVQFPSFANDEVIPITGVKRLIAKNMSRSKRRAAHFACMGQVDARQLVECKQKLQQASSDPENPITYMPLLIRALSLTLAKHPSLNSNYDADRGIMIKHHVHNIGIAARTPSGLVVPVIHAVEKMSFAELVTAYNRLMDRAANNRLEPADLTGSTFTISNFGALGQEVKWGFLVINYPEVAILGTSRIQKQPVVEGDQVVARETINLSWSFDHRVIDGEMAVEFMRDYSALLQDPDAIVETKTGK